MTDTNRYRVLQRPDETEDQVRRALIEGKISDWVPVVSSREDGWRLVNLRHVLWIETGPEESGYS
jgi:hypothetical protein